MHYYNEFDSKAAAWLRELIHEKLIPNGVVDERSIVDVRGSELREFVQVHLFAGISGWSVALRLADWPDERPVWTGSCPCQPFSGSGDRRGIEDARDIWPHMFRLIRECRPNVCFGEQVADAIAHGWLDRLSSNLESEDYAIGSCVLGAHSAGAPHIRSRLFWVADTNSPDGFDKQRKGISSEEVPILSIPSGDVAIRRGHEDGSSHWSDTRLISCRDGMRRRIKPGISPLAFGLPGYVDLLRGSGNAICPQTAAAFIKAYLHVRSVKRK